MDKRYNLEVMSYWVATKFIEAKISNCCIRSSFILFETLKKMGYEPQLVLGYIMIERKEKYAQPHIWVEVDGKICDVGMLVVMNDVVEMNLDISLLKIAKYSREIPEGYVQAFSRYELPNGRRPLYPSTSKVNRFFDIYNRYMEDSVKFWLGEIDTKECQIRRDIMKRIT